MGDLVGLWFLIDGVLDVFWFWGWFVVGMVGYVEIDVDGFVYLVGVWCLVEMYGM